jgi:hypothetical protein
MASQLRLVILANAMLVLLFALFSYVEYTTISSPFVLEPISVLYYPLIQAKETAFYSYALLTFVFSTAMNLRFIIDLHRNQEKNDKSSA